MCIWLAALVLCIFTPRVIGLCDVGSQHTNVTFGVNQTYRAPNYPDRYPKNQNCEHLYVAIGDYKIRVEFQEFEVEDREDGVCIYDYVEFYDGATRSGRHLGRYCGSKIPPVIVSTSNELLVVFVSDGSLQIGTFSAEIESVETDYIEPFKIGQCGGLLHADEGEISSPGYPYGYEADEYCVYFISAVTDEIIQVRFTSFDLEIHQSCQFDFVEILDGNDVTNSRVIGRYCGGNDNKPPHTIKASGSTMTIIFHSDISVHYEGFFAEFTVSSIGFPPLPSSGIPNSNSVPVCDYTRAIITDRGGVIVSHESYPNGRYPNDALCVMAVVGSRLYDRVYLAFEEVNLQSVIDNDDTCLGDSGDYIEVIDRNLFIPSLLGRLCNKQTDTFTSFYQIQIQFITDSTQSEDQTGFKAVYAIYYTDPLGCETGDFQCRNDRCIADYLVCDGHNHCGDNTDEDTGCGQAKPDEPYDNTTSSYEDENEESTNNVNTGLIIGLTVAIVAFLAVTICLIMTRLCSDPSQRSLSLARFTNIQKAWTEDKYATSDSMSI
ncbi:tolloid-like protein 1 [Glandiceps talaboti]